MDAVIVPNRRNTATELMLPVKMLDGVALGLPIIVSKLATIQYYFADEMVFFFEPDNVESLTDVILSAYDNKALRQQKVKRATEFIDQYGWEKHKSDLINMYETIS
jgi:glycosyltransferase involved in cell wall biosynthesis